MLNYLLHKVHFLGREIEIHAVKQQDADYLYECHAESGNNPIVEIGSLSHVGIYRGYLIQFFKHHKTPIF